MAAKRFALLATALLVSASLPVAALAAAEEPPAFQATLGGPSHAEMYPSGMEVAPDGTLVVADTGNDRVSKYAPDGTRLWTVGTHGSGTGQFANPRDIGIDSAGNVYVADTRNSRVVKLDPDGRWLTAWSGPAGETMSFPLGLSVTGDRVYLADSGKNRVRVYDTVGNQLRSVAAATGPCAIGAPRDADADAAGNIYVANYKVNNVVKFGPTGTCQTAWGSTGGGDGQFRALYGVRIAHDPVLGTEAVYVADANNSRLQVFTTAGGFVAKVGEKGSGPGQFLELRRVAVAADGDLWAADLWGWRLQRFDRTPTGYGYAQTVGAPLPAPADTAVFHQPRQIAFDGAGNLVVADTVHHRVVKMAPDGTVLGICGGRGSKTGEFNWPRGVAVDPATGQIWVADTKQYRLQIIDPDCRGVVKFGTLGTGDDNFNWPFGVVIRPDDRVAFVADTMNHRVKAYDVATRTFLASFGIKGSGDGRFNEPGAIAVDPRTGRVLVADTKNHRIVELTYSRVGGFAVSRTLAGGLANPAGVAADDDGNVYVADTGNNRVVVFGPSGAVRVDFGASGRFDAPEGISLDAAGRILVADTYHDRIERFAPLAPAGPGEEPGGGPDSVPPDSAVSAPTANASLPPGSVTVSGTATDDRAVASVRVAVKNRATGLWWRADGTWGPFAAHPAVLGQPGAPSTAWTWSWTPPGPGAYGVSVSAHDAAGNAEPAPRPWVPFTAA